MSNRRESTNSSSNNSREQSGSDNRSVQTSQHGSDLSLLNLDQKQLNDTTVYNNQVGNRPFGHQQGRYGSAKNNSMPDELRSMILDGNNTSDNQHSQPRTALGMLTNQNIPPPQQPTPTNSVTYTIEITFHEPFTVDLPVVSYSSSGTTPQNYLVNANTYTIVSDTVTRVDNNGVYGSRMIDIEHPNYNLNQQYYRDRNSERISSYELVPSIDNITKVVNDFQRLANKNGRSNHQP